MKFSKLAQSAVFLAVMVVIPAKAQIVAFDFNTDPYLDASVTTAGLSVSSIDISTSGSIDTNQTTGTYFTDEPYISDSGTWNRSSQEEAKSFYFTITALDGYTFDISGISFDAYTTGTGPTALGVTINSTSVYSNAFSSSVLTNVSQSVAMTGLTSATIYIQGWQSDSVSTTGAGPFRLDNIAITGAVSAVPEPSTYAAFAGVAMLGFAAYRRRQRKGVATAA